MVHTAPVRLRAATLGVFMIVLAGFAAAISPATGSTQAGCGPNVVFLVWPHGHPAIPRYSEFPHISNPHIELYVGLKGYDVTHAGAWVIGGRPPKGITRGGFFTNCANYGDTLTSGSVANAQVITKQTAVKCTLKGSPAVDVKFRAGGVADFYLHTGKTMIATAHVTPSSVKLTVPESCTLIAPPHP